MASEPERAPADDDTVVAQGNGRRPTEEVTQADEEWPVSDLYYVSPDEEAPTELADDDASKEAVAAAAPATGTAARRRFPPEIGVGGMLAVLGVVAALTLGAVLLALDPEEPAATPQEPAGAQATTPAPTETTPAPANAAVEVADVEGITRAEATRALEQQGFRVRVTGSPSDRSRGEVLTQAPAAGSEIAEGTVIALVVSQGSAQSPARSEVSVPGVLGLSASDAASAMREAGLVPRVRLVPSSERRGTVVDQSPAEGTEVEDGATVKLDVAKPRPTVTLIEIPDVVGSTATAARSELRNAGLTVATTTVVAQESAGTVISQSPRAGAEARKGTTVKLTVSAGPAEVDVPSVTGLDEASARSELERAGFRVQVTDESVVDPAQDGVVVRQTPAGGSSAQDGATVTIVVGRID